MFWVEFTPHLNEKRNYQSISPETLNMFSTLWIHTEIAQKKIFDLRVLEPSGAAINFPKSDWNHNLTPLWVFSDTLWFFFVYARTLISIFFLIVNARNLVETKNSYVQNVASEKNFDPRENKSFFMLGVVSHFDFGQFAGKLIAVPPGSGTFRANFFIWVHSIGVCSIKKHVQSPRGY